MIKRIGFLLLGLFMFGLAFGGTYYYQHRLKNQQNEQIEEISKTALKDLKEQKRLAPYAARFVAVMAAPANRLTIVPGTVRYELDTGAIRPQDVKWDKEEQQLTITLPMLILVGPAMEPSNIRQYGVGGLSYGEQALDDASRKAAKASLLEQAIDDTPMHQAKDTVRNSIQRSFAMPLSAAGIKARVVVKFVGEQDDADADSEEQIEGI